MEGGGVSDDEIDSELNKLFAQMQTEGVPLGEVRKLDQGKTFLRAPSVVQAELIQAVQDYAQIWREKAAMEIRRAEALETIAQEIEETGCAKLDQAIMSKDSPGNDRSRNRRNGLCKTGSGDYVEGFIPQRPSLIEKPPGIILQP